jgi:hypothetical protein
MQEIKHLKFILIFVSVIILLLISYTIGISLAQTATSTNIIKFPVKVSTRDHFDNMTGELLPVHNKTDYAASYIPGLQRGECPNEIAIIVHGWGLNQSQADERFVRANMSLDDKKYQNNNNNNNTVVGFSWDANPNKNNWTIAKSIAKDNGPKLAQFIFDYMEKCSDSNSKVRLVAHSLGSRVVLSSLDSLYNNQEWTTKNFTVASVHVMGAAVDDEEVSKDLSYILKNPAIVKNMSEWYDVYGIKSAYGKAIENVTSHFYNLFDPKDKALIKFYMKKDENDTALGVKGKQEGITAPSNYNQTDVQDEILALHDADADGNWDLGLNKTESVEIGDNHGGYFGFTNMTNGKKMFVDNGAMDVVVEQWRNETNNISDM